MRKHLLFVLFTTLSFYSFSQLPDSVVRRIVIVRHGEKPKSGDNLTCQGLNRALALPDTLYKRFGRPDHSYVPTIKTGTKTSSVRMFQTITPYAVQYDLTVNSNYPESDTVKFAKHLKTKKGLILVVWEHTNIPGIARHLGVKNPDPWLSTDFDSIWIIDFVQNKKTKAITIYYSTQQEGITPSSTCPD
ncbi:MAG TPA: histidine phosphatase family protein [Chitinophagaceae bacterium]|nr:histidine phosphatase family protein [Chitinophagaceae bacterium]